MYCKLFPTVGLAFWNCAPAMAIFCSTFAEQTDVKSSEDVIFILRGTYGLDYYKSSLTSDSAFSSAEFQSCRSSRLFNDYQPCVDEGASENRSRKRLWLTHSFTCGYVAFVSFS